MTDNPVPQITENQDTTDDIRPRVENRHRLPEKWHARVEPHARLIALVGIVLTLLSTLLAWCYVRGTLGDVTLYFNPGAVQLTVGAMVLPALALLVLSSPRVGNLADSFNVAAALRGTGLALLVVWVLLVAGIAADTGAIANMEFGLFVLLVGAALITLAGYGYAYRISDADHPRLQGWQQALALSIGVAAAFGVIVHTLGIRDSWIFIITIAALIGMTLALVRSEVGEWIGAMATAQRRTMLLATFVAAFALPLSPSGADDTMSVAVQVIIFAATAVGLNIVVGLAGLLDLGYIAFLGAGAYVGAVLSGSAFATINWHPPFIVTVLIGAAFAGALGLLIGSPTLRVSGDYLAIVTLAFGEIFRFTALNLDGKNGPDLTNGPDGIFAIPDLTVFGFDFGQSHSLFGIEISRFANYYLLLLVVMGFIILVFSRLNESRIGRGWVAIREDEKAAEAMGVNVFGLKVLAFVTGASLAGLAGTIKAHVDTTVTPDQYIFLESAFLLSAVVLGGMGTVTGVIVGAVLLKLLPEKLRFFSDYRLLLFGILLVVMMRFRPEGLIQVNRRHPADDYPEAVEDGKRRPLDAAFLKRGVS